MIWIGYPFDSEDSNRRFQNIFPELRHYSFVDFQPFPKRDLKKRFDLSGWPNCWITVENQRMHTFLRCILGLFTSWFIQIGWSHNDFWINSNRWGPGFPTEPKDEMRKNGFRMNLGSDGKAYDFGNRRPRKVWRNYFNGSGRFECKICAIFPLRTWKCGFNGANTAFWFVCYVQCFRTVDVWRFEDGVIFEKAIFRGSFQYGFDEQN